MDGLKTREASLLTVLLENKNRWGEVHLTMDDLSERTSMSRTSLWRALVALTEQGYVQTTRTKRNFGKLYKNVYRLLIDGETSTASQYDTINLDSKDNQDNQTKNINTSYLYSLGCFTPEEKKMVNKWSSEDDGLVGFGLTEAYLPPEKIKRVPKTRHLRPREDWTANDVAAEFTMLAYDKVRGIPGMVNTRDMAIGLSQYRKKHGITAKDEMAAMDKFFTDDRNLLSLKKYPKRSVGIFLNFLTQNIADVSNEVTIETAVAMADQLEYLYASDGRKFLKSISGRAELADYEKELEE